MSLNTVIVSKYVREQKSAFIRAESLGVLFILAFTVGVAHFALSSEFGFYEDDYNHVTPAIGWDASSLLRWFTEVFERWPQGRPVHFFLPRLFSYLGTGLGGSQAMYWIALIIATLNAFLFYTLLKRVGPMVFALVGALTFALFPADTTHAFLTHAFGLHTSLSFLIIASLLYISGWKAISYIAILGSLITYETAFFVFAGVPLLQNRWDKHLAKESVKHVAVLIGMIALILAIRWLTGDPRLQMGSDSWLLVPMKALASLIIGPASVAYSFFYGPFRTVIDIDPAIAIGIAVTLSLFVLVFFRQATYANQEHAPVSSPSAIEKVFLSLRLPTQYWRIAQLLLAGLVLLSLAYVASFTHFPPIRRHGRLTSVHLAATFGGSIIVACLATAFFYLSKARGRKGFAVVGVATYMSLLVGYGVRIQMDFRQSWRDQRSFWTSVIQATPDLDNDTIVFAQLSGLTNPRYIQTHSWADPTVLMQIYDFPDEWSNPPRLFVIDGNLEEFVAFNGAQFEWTVPIATSPSHMEFLPDSNVILLEASESGLERRYGQVMINGKGFNLKSRPTNTTPAFDEGPLYEILIHRLELEGSA